MNNRINELMKNTFIFGISNFSSKILVFLMLPFYTRILTAEQFGTANLIISIISVLLPVFTMCVAEGALRFSLSKSTNKQMVFTTGIAIIVLGFILLLFLFPIFELISPINQYILFFYSIYLSSALYDYTNKFARGLNKIKLIGFVGVISTITLVTTNILFLVQFNLGIEGYLISQIFMNVAGFFTIFIFGKLYNYISFNKPNTLFIKEFQNYNVPLIPNRISWILISSFSNYSLAFLWNNESVGIYSAANRIPSLITSVYGIIQQALLLTVIDEYESDNKSDVFVLTYRLLNSLLLIIAITINIMIKPLAILIFSNEFVEGYKIVPLLVISAFFGAVHGNLTTLFSATKNTKVLFKNSFFGLVITAFLNLLLVPKFGIYGASLSSTLVYFIMWFRMYKIVSITIDINNSLKNDLICYCSLAVQWVFLMLTDGIVFYLSSVLCALIILFMNYNNIRIFVQLIFNTIKNKILEDKI